MGRHFRLPNGARAVSGRDEEENRVLENLAGGSDYLFQARRKPGSLVLLRKESGPEEVERELAARICARYSKEKKKRLEIRVWKKGDRGGDEIITAKPLSDSKLAALRI